MPASTLSLTFTNLVLRVAENMGLASYAGSTVAVPTDAHDLELCKRLVNDGYRRFLNSHPRGRWFFLTPIIRIQLESDVGDYDLPDGFRGDVVGTWTIVERGYGSVLVQTDEATIRGMRSSLESSGTPTTIAYRPKPRSHGQTTHGWEALLWPTPDTTLTLEAQAQLQPDALVNDADYHVGGFMHDETVLAAALAESERWRGGGGSVQEANFQRCLIQSVMLDAKAAPRQIGGGSRLDVPWNGEVTFDGVSVTDLE